MDGIRRVAIEDHVPAGPDRQGTLNKLLAHPTMTAIAVALDQVHARSRDGTPPGEARRASEADVAHAGSLVAELEVAAQAGRSMVAAMRRQLGENPPGPPEVRPVAHFGAIRVPEDAGRPFNAAGDVTGPALWVDHTPPSSAAPPPGPQPAEVSPIGETPDEHAPIDAEGRTILGGDPVHVEVPIPPDVRDVIDHMGPTETIGGPEQSTIPPDVSDAEVRARDAAESEMNNPDASAKTGKRRR